MSAARIPWALMILLATLTACPSRTPTPAPPAVGLADDSVVQALWRERTSGGVRTEPCLGPGDLIGLSRDHRTVADMISEAGGFNEHAGGRVQLFPAKGSPCDGTAQRPTLQPIANVEPIEIDVNEQYASAQSNPLLLPVVGGDSI